MSGITFEKFCYKIQNDINSKQVQDSENDEYEIILVFMHFCSFKSIKAVKK